MQPLQTPPQLPAHGFRQLAFGHLSAELQRFGFTPGFDQHVDQGQPYLVDLRTVGKLLDHFLIKSLSGTVLALPAVDIAQTAHGLVRLTALGKLRQIGGIGRHGRGQVALPEIAFGLFGQSFFRDATVILRDLRYPMNATAQQKQHQENPRRKTAVHAPFPGALGCRIKCLKAKYLHANN